MEQKLFADVRPGDILYGLCIGHYASMCEYHVSAIEMASDMNMRIYVRERDTSLFVMKYNTCHRLTHFKSVYSDYNTCVEALHEAVEVQIKALKDTIVHAKRCIVNLKAEKSKWKKRRKNVLDSIN